MNNIDESFINKTKWIFNLSVTVPPLSPPLDSYSNHTAHCTALHMMGPQPQFRSLSMKVVELNKTFRIVKQKVC